MTLASHCQGIAYADNDRGAEDVFKFLKSGISEKFQDDIAKLKSMAGRFQLEESPPN